MKELRGTASGAVEANVTESLALLEAVDQFPDWYSELVRRVVVLERDDQGRPTKVRASLHVSRGPLNKELDLVLAVKVSRGGSRGATVTLSRVPNHSNDPEEFQAIWRVEEGRIHLELEAKLDVPRFVPIGGVGDSMADGFVTAATKKLAALDL